MGWVSDLFGGGAKDSGRKRMKKQKSYYENALSQQGNYYTNLLNRMQSNMQSLQSSANLQAESMQAEANKALAEQRKAYQRQARAVAKQRKTAAFALENRQTKKVMQAKSKMVRDSVLNTGETISGGRGSVMGRAYKPKRRLASKGNKRSGRGGSRPA